MWDNLFSTLTDPATLKALALEYLTTLNTPGDIGPRRRAIEGKLGDLRRQEAVIVRRIADSCSLDALDDALNEIAEEKTALQRELAELQRRDDLVAAQASPPDRIDAFAAACRDQLADPDNELMADIYDALDVKLHLIEPFRFEGTASIPVPHDMSGQFREEGPQRS